MRGWVGSWSVAGASRPLFFRIASAGKMPTVREGRMPSLPFHYTSVITLFHSPLDLLFEHLDLLLLDGQLLAALRQLGGQPDFGWIGVQVRVRQLVILRQCAKCFGRRFAANLFHRADRQAK